MNREEVNNLLPILQAFAEGKEIQYKDNGSWVDFDKGEGLAILQALSYPSNYRIKPDPKYRPFKDAEECWNEMLKHQPFGWVRINNDRYCITSVVNNDVYIDDTIINNLDAFDNYTFADGTPFGIKEESED